MRLCLLGLCFLGLCLLGLPTSAVHGGEPPCAGRLPLRCYPRRESQISEYRLLMGGQERC